ncbi:DUF1206 domain-containing protein [Marinactinospora endophytica]
MTAADGGRAAKRRARAAGREAADSTWLLRLARVGLAAKGLLYLLIGWLAVRIGFEGGGSREADNAGALQLVAGTPGGTVVLWAAVAGLAGLAVWQLLIALVGGRYGERGAGERLACAGRTVLYAALCVTVASVLVGGGTGSQDARSQTLTARIMELPAGRLLVGAVGVGLVVAGVVFVWIGVTRRFGRDLRTGAIPKEARPVVTVLGVAGNTTKGVVVAAAGVLVCWAAIAFDPDRAQGLDGTLRTFAETPAGPWLLVAVALGVCVYGLYCFCVARWPRA